MTGPRATPRFAIAAGSARLTLRRMRAPRRRRAAVQMVEGPTVPGTDPAKTGTVPLTGPQRAWMVRTCALLGLRPGAPAVTAAENARLSALSPEALAATDLTRTDTDALFDGAAMDRLKDAPIRGEGDPALAVLMRAVVRGVSGPRREQVMAALARIVGVPPTAERLDLDYGRFLVVRRQQAVKGAAKNDSVPGLDEDRHPEFMASRGQLMFGRVLGEAFGIHEVFAALLSPTGGLVGPGNWLIPGVVKAGHLAPDNPVAIHGTVHDAAGYLHTFHDTGPGYNYRDSGIEILGTGSPLSGQISGIAYWVKEAGDDYLLRRADAAVLAVEKSLKGARDAVASKIAGLLAAFGRKAKAKARAPDGGPPALEVAEAIVDARDRAGSAAVGTGRTAGAPISDAATGRLEAAWDVIWS